MFEENLQWTRQKGRKSLIFKAKIFSFPYDALIYRYESLDTNKKLGRIQTYFQSRRGRIGNLRSKNDFNSHITLTFKDNVAGMDGSKMSELVIRMWC